MRQFTLAAAFLCLMVGKQDPKKPQISGDFVLNNFVSLTQWIQFCPVCLFLTCLITDHISLISR